MNVLLAELQYGDTGYPAGAYAHSLGLETAVEERWIGGAAELESVVRSLLVWQTARTDSVAAAASSRAAMKRDAGDFCAIDRRLTATRPARETREASLRVGRQMLETAAACEWDSWIEELRDLVAANNADGNQAAIVGAILGRHGALPEDAAALVMWSTSTSLLNAAVRLGTITHVEAQRILTHLRPLMASLTPVAAAADWKQMGGSVPLLEICQMRHEIAQTRLFAS
jgi:urease accessory protein